MSTTPTIDEILASTRAFTKKASAMNSFRKEASFERGSNPTASFDVAPNVGSSATSIKVPNPVGTTTVNQKAEVTPTAGDSTSTESATKMPSFDVKPGATKLASEILAAGRSLLTTKQAEPEVKPAQRAEKASGEQLVLSGDILSKIAATILATEDGFNMVNRELTKSAGAETAAATMQALVEQASMIEKQAAAEYHQGAADAEALIKVAMDKQAAAEYHQGAANAEALIKVAMDKQAAAEYHQGAADAEALIKVAMDKQAAAEYHQGAADAEALIKAAQAEMEEAAAQQMPPEEAQAAMSGMGGEGGEEPQLSPEEIEQAISMMVQQGQLDPQTAQSLMEYLMQADQAQTQAAQAAPAAPAPEEAGMEAQAAFIRNINALRAKG